MRRSGLLVYFFSLLFANAYSQGSIDHWESIINAENTWRYFLGTSEPPSSWVDTGFDDGSWSQGPGGFGYGDGDDGTVTPTVTSVYLRRKFTISDLAEIEQAILLGDYDDGFIAYINGIEIARSGMSGDKPAYNQFAIGNHEAALYQGFYPDEYGFLRSEYEQFLNNGENILAIQVHNVNATSSDLSSNFYFVVGLNSSATSYQTIPTWFREPVEAGSSNIPLILLDTYGASIPDEPKINAFMSIIDNGPGNINHVSDPPTDYQGHIGIELRGSSSQGFPKKQYAVELWTASGLDTSASILGLPAEEDWILGAPYTDKSLIRNLLTFKLGEDLGWYAPRTRMVEVYLNNFYQGVYMLTEKIKRDRNRVDINKLNPDENSGDDLTGGYIVKLDKYDGATQGFGWDSPFPPPGRSENQTIHFQYHYPKESLITAAQRDYIENHITAFEQALAGPKFKDPQQGYRKFINVESFIDFAIINELSKNVDGYRLSTFMYKDKDSNDGLLYLGPIWDFNLAFGNANYCEGGNAHGWAWDFNSYCNGDHWLIPFWWDQLLKDPAYVRQFQSRWSELRQGVYSEAAILGYIDSVAAVLEDPQTRNFQKWPVLGEWIWPNNYVGGSYQNEINYLKNWISMRLSWLDINIGGLAIVTDIPEIPISNFAIYPNPNDGTFQIAISGEYKNVELNLFDNLGRAVQFTKTISPATRNLSFGSSNLPAGIYLLKITDGNKLMHTEKIIVN